MTVLAYCPKCGSGVNTITGRGKRRCVQCDYIWIPT